MKEVKAYIKPHKLDDVVMILHRIEGLTGMSVSDVRGFGRGRGRTSAEQEQEMVGGYIQHVKLEIICRDDLVKDVVSAVEEGAHTGLRGDGEIYVSPIETAVRVSTGERGEKAVQPIMPQQVCTR